MTALPPLDRVVVISPHLDDAAFSCGQFLAAHPGATVVTVFAGLPPPDTPLTDWDLRCGFHGAQEAVMGRRKEDRQALATLGARAVWMDFLDHQYGASTTPEQVGAVLRLVLGELGPQTVLLPLGLFHSDHLLAHEATAQALRELPRLRSLVYEDALYRGMRGLLQQRLATLAQDSVCLTPVRLQSEGSSVLKEHAVQAYASQLRGFGPGGFDDTRAAERYWLLEPGDAA